MEGKPMHIARGGIEKVGSGDCNEMWLFLQNLLEELPNNARL